MRGTVGDGEVERVQLFDGRFDTGYRITAFNCWNVDPLSANDGIMMLATEEDTDWSSAPSLNAADNTQIAWGGFSSGTYIWFHNQGIVDPDNMIIQDLFIHAQETSSGDSLSYLIKLEKYDIAEWEGALGLVRNKSQG
jgi:hypothetical protein